MPSAFDIQPKTLTGRGQGLAGRRRTEARCSPRPDAEARKRPPSAPTGAGANARTRRNRWYSAPAPPVGSLMPAKSPAGIQTARRSGWLSVRLATRLVRRWMPSGRGESTDRNATSSGQSSPSGSRCTQRRSTPRPLLVAEGLGREGRLACPRPYRPGAIYLVVADPEDKQRTPATATANCDEQHESEVDHED